MFETYLAEVAIGVGVKYKEPNEYLTFKRTFFMIVLVILVNTIIGCTVESVFYLSPDSRLPRWFMLPKGFTRAEVTVQEIKYLDHSEFILYATNPISAWNTPGHELSRVNAVSDGALSLTEKQNAQGGYDKDPYPLYEALTVNGITEVLEYKQREPIFYITDDPEVRMRLGLRHKPN